MKTSISAIILTKNEQENIEQCFSSISWCDEIIIIDDYSEDNTIERIKNYELSLPAGKAGIKKQKIKIFQRHLNRDFASQRNFGLNKATGNWILFIDADEVVHEELKREIKTKAQNSAIAQNCDGYYLKRKDYFLGRWLRYGETADVKLLRLAKKNAGFWQGRVHETWEVKGEIGELKNPILHYPHQAVAAFLKDINWYTDIVAQYWLEQGRRIKNWEILVYPMGKFLQNYIIRLGVLDDIPGLIVAFMMSFHSFLVRSKVWLRQHKNG